ncbi:SHQ1 protein-domain-containing protein [Zopfochytrium polystomum]|nr:SHQ1 protein-domain-containing protein [Zopfochytrium polystomum]
MLTPSFTVAQDDDFVTVVLKCPYVKSRDFEFFVDGCIFKFHVSPYFLRLTFPCPVCEDGRESATYDISAGTITVRLPKQEKGQFFPHLDLLRTLLDPSMSRAAASTGEAPPAHNPVHAPLDQPAAMTRRPLIEEDDDDAEDADVDWLLPQELPDEPVGPKFGFNNSHCGSMAHLRELLGDVVDVLDLERQTPAARRELRTALENAKFDEDHYMSDFINDDEIKSIIKFKPESWAALKRMQANRQAAADGGQGPLARPDLLDSWLEFTESERDQIIRLPRRKPLIGGESSETRTLFLGLVDILFAYCYDYRVTEGDHNVESGWTISKLSGTLSCFETFTSLRDAVYCGVRRSLAYPLYRHIELSSRVLEDVVVLFKLGRHAIIRSLLSIKKILQSSGEYHALDRLYIEDYCLWTLDPRQCRDQDIRSLASELNHLKVDKATVGWPLVELESLAREIAADPDDDDDPHGERQ